MPERSTTYISAARQSSCAIVALISSSLVPTANIRVAEAACACSSRGSRCGRLEHELALASSECGKIQHEEEQRKSGHRGGDNGVGGVVTSARKRLRGQYEALERSACHAV